MAKMFYTLDEAAAKLGKSAEAVKEMAAKGQLQEFRDRDRLMFKVEQVDLLSGEDQIQLADSGGMDILSGSAASGTGMALESSKESTGISIFDADQTEEADANAVTRVSNAPMQFSDPGKSGSGSRAGLLDMSKEPDDTSLGGGLLDDVYGSETVAQQTAAEPAMSGVEGGGEGGALFETPASAESFEPAAAGAGVMMMAETVDGAGSGLVGGLAFGMVLALALAVVAVVLGLSGAAGSGMLGTLGDNFMILVGAAAGVCLIAGILGWVIGKRS
jgi:hypothetical protein